MLSLPSAKSQSHIASKDFTGADKTVIYIKDKVRSDAFRMSGLTREVLHEHIHLSTAEVTLNDLSAILEI